DLLVSNKATEKIVKNFLALYREGKATNRFQKKRSKDIRIVTYYIAQSVRDFCGYHGMMWKRGVTGVMSQKILSHGKYADKRLTDEEMERADQFIKSKWGLDSDVYRWFWIGIESCARFSALHNMSLEYTKHVSKKTGKVTYIMTAYETKTKHIKGGKWIKYITRPDTQKSIDLLKTRGGTRIYESKEADFPFTQMISKSMKEVYSFLGKTEYFENHPTHALRHIGAHYWLARKNYNYGLVALIGGWITIDELRKSYGEMPPEKVLEIIEENDNRLEISPLLH
ncbi:MAG: helix-turn-helix domain-containing protein, partial [Nitrosopumilaceae archaeon]